MRRWALAVALLALPGSAAAQAAKDTPVDAIVQGLLPPDVESEGPTTRGIGGVRVEPRVAPTGATPGAPGGAGRIALAIRFKLDSAEITPDSFAQLRAVAAALSDPRLQGTRILVEGHTDSQGSDAHNQGLSERRAAAVRRFLVEEGQVAAARLDARGYGKTRPLPDVAQDTEEGRARNRRVEFVNLGRDPVVVTGRPGEPQPSAAAPADLKVGLVVTYRRGGETKTLWSGGVLMHGEGYRITVTPSEDSYVYVYRIDATGTARPLFPNGQLSPASNPLRAQEAYRLPADDSWLGVEGTPGDEAIVVLAARGELPDAQARAVRQDGQARAAVTRAPAPRIRADVTPDGVFTYRLSFEHR
jgi:outer membrane protein OmpA-like peptidoglycan-associated protein